MPHRPKRLDISASPELAKLAEEVAGSREPRVLVRDSEELVEIRPVARVVKRQTAGTRRLRLLRLDEVRGIGGKLHRPVPWSEVERIAAEDHAGEVACEGL